jgi:hypothetical protein
MAIGLSNKRSKPAAASVFKSAAFDVSSSAMMLVDRDLKVQFVNAATVSLLTKHKDAFSKLWPGFNPDAMIGVCIDTFHKKRKWFMPPIPRFASQRQVATQDPRIVMSTSFGSSETAYDPWITCCFFHSGPSWSLGDMAIELPSRRNVQGSRR